MVMASRKKYPIKHQRIMKMESWKKKIQQPMVAELYTDEDKLFFLLFCMHENWENIAANYTLLTGILFGILRTYKKNSSSNSKNNNNNSISKIHSEKLTYSSAVNGSRESFDSLTQAFIYTYILRLVDVVFSMHSSLHFGSIFATVGVCVYVSFMDRVVWH